MEPPMNLADYADWSEAYQHLNLRLFNDRLPEVVFTWSRRANTFGYASPDRFDDRDAHAKMDELALNPDYFLHRSDLETLSTLAHEMVHIEQYRFGKPGRSRYHNAEWGDWMDRIGLTPSHTGFPGGRRTGQQMSHYIVDGGPFALAAAELLASGWRIKRGSTLHAAKEKGDPSKVKFTCPECGLNAWAKETAKLGCIVCGREMVAAGVRQAAPEPRPEPERPMKDITPEPKRLTLALDDEPEPDAHPTKDLNPETAEDLALLADLVSPRRGRMGRPSKAAIKRARNKQGPVFSGL
jgi:predicted SprT family Zn-dependent metalloprotease